MRRHDSNQNQAVDRVVSHGFDPEDFQRRMSGLYGRVFERQVARIQSHLEGTSVLDVGSGSGYLSYCLKQRGYEPTAIDVAPHSLEFSKEVYGIDIQTQDIYDTEFADKSFDSIVMKEVVYHLDMERALPEVSRLTRSRLVIFQGTLNPILRLARIMLRHREHNRRSPKFYHDLLVRHGWKVVAFKYFDPLAFYLRGGVISPVLCPRYQPLCSAVMACDSALERAAGVFRLTSLIGSRFLMAAEPPQ